MEGRDPKKRSSRWSEPEPASAGPAPPGAADGGDGKKRRRSRWEPEEPKPPGMALALPGGGTIKLPPSLAALVDTNPETVELNRKLQDLDARIMRNDFSDPRPEHERSPSPPPEYDGLGVRTNTREIRMRARMAKEKQDIIQQLLAKSPSFRAPSNYRPDKLMRKIYVPVKEYPGYNFIGLIIGPRGNTQKRMERETGAKISIRGKGSVKEGRARADRNPQPDENDDMHVRIEADTQEQLDMACKMVERILVPTDDSRNEHKRMQLRELASLNGTLRSDEYWEQRRAEENAVDIYRLPDQVKGRVDEMYSKDVAKFTGEDPGKANAEYQSFLDEIGGRAQGGVGDQPEQRGPPGAMGAGPGYGGKRTASGEKEIDESNLYVGHLPESCREPDLQSLFGAYGPVEEARIILDRLTGGSRGFGFVKFADKECAKQAIANLDGHFLDGRTITVNVAGAPRAPRPAMRGPMGMHPSRMGGPPGMGGPPMGGMMGGPPGMAGPMGMHPSRMAGMAGMGGPPQQYPMGAYPPQPGPPGAGPTFHGGYGGGGPGYYPPQPGPPGGMGGHFDPYGQPQGPGYYGAGGQDWSGHAGGYGAPPPLPAAPPPPPPPPPPEEEEEEGAPPPLPAGPPAPPGPPASEGAGGAGKDKMEDEYAAFMQQVQ